MHRGIIKCYGPRGFGYIKRDSGRDIWFHRGDSPNVDEWDFRPGQRVTFSIFASLGREWAADLRLSD